MSLPFTKEQFLEVFKDYNMSVWPAQIGLNVLALLPIYLVFSRSRLSSRVSGLILTLLWVWMGIAYHLLYFSSINKGAYLFGGAFILQGLLFFYYSVYQERISFHLQLGSSGIIGCLMMLFALGAYPLLGKLNGHTYPYVPTFGLPCPTTIYTLGLLLCADKKAPLAVILIPLAWSVIGFTASFLLGIREDISLLICGVLFVALRIGGKKSIQPQAVAS